MESVVELVSFTLAVVTLPRYGVSKKLYFGKFFLAVENRSLPKSGQN
jgi:hypothetical protein